MEIEPSGLENFDVEEAVRQLADESSGLHGRWTNEEHGVFVSSLKKFGKDWKAISNLIPTRTLVQIRTHAQKYFGKLKKTGYEMSEGGNMVPCAPEGAAVRAAGVETGSPRVRLRRSTSQRSSGAIEEDELTDGVAAAAPAAASAAAAVGRRAGPSAFLAPSIEQYTMNPEPAGGAEGGALSEGLLRLGVGGLLGVAAVPPPRLNSSDARGTVVRIKLRRTNGGTGTPNSASGADINHVPSMTDLNMFYGDDSVHAGAVTPSYHAGGDDTSDEGGSSANKAGGASVSGEIGGGAGARTGYFLAPGPEGAASTPSAMRRLQVDVNSLSLAAGPGSPVAGDGPAAGSSSQRRAVVSTRRRPSGVAAPPSGRSSRAGMQGAGNGVPGSGAPSAPSPGRAPTPTSASRKRPLSGHFGGFPVGMAAVRGPGAGEPASSGPTAHPSVAVSSAPGTGPGGGLATSASGAALLLQQQYASHPPSSAYAAVLSASSSLHTSSSDGDDTVPTMMVHRNGGSGGATAAVASYSYGCGGAGGGLQDMWGPAAAGSSAFPPQQQQPLNVAPGLAPPADYLQPPLGSSVPLGRSLSVPPSLGAATGGAGMAAAWQQPLRQQWDAAPASGPTGTVLPQIIQGLLEAEAHHEQLAPPRQQQLPQHATRGEGYTGMRMAGSDATSPVGSGALGSATSSDAAPPRVASQHSLHSHSPTRLAATAAAGATVHVAANSFESPSPTAGEGAFARGGYSAAGPAALGHFGAPFPGPSSAHRLVPSSVEVRALAVRGFSELHAGATQWDSSAAAAPLFHGHGAVAASSLVATGHPAAAGPGPAGGSLDAEIPRVHGHGRGTDGEAAHHYFGHQPGAAAGFAADSTSCAVPGASSAHRAPVAAPALRGAELAARPPFGTHSDAAWPPSLHAPGTAAPGGVAIASFAPTASIATSSMHAPPAYADRDDELERQHEAGDRSSSVSANSSVLSSAQAAPQRASSCGCTSDGLDSAPASPPAVIVTPTNDAAGRANNAAKKAPASFTMSHGAAAAAVATAVPRVVRRASDAAPGVSSTLALQHTSLQPTIPIVPRSPLSTEPLGSAATFALRQAHQQAGDVPGGATASVMSGGSAEFRASPILFALRGGVAGAQNAPGSRSLARSASHSSSLDSVFRGTGGGHT